MKRYESYKDSGVKWLGEIPGHWEVYKLKYLFRLNKIKNVGNTCNTILSLSYGKIIIKKDINEGLTPESYESYQLLNKGDIVIRSTDLQNDHTSLRTGLVKSDGAITSAYIGLKNLNVNLYDSRYYHYFLHDWDITKAIYNEGKGLRQSLNWDDIKNMLLPVLDINEQTAIANYLDTVTSKIDEAISQQQKMIDLLNERKQIIINNAVTKGLNPDAPMKDSGVEWIGEIPEHWEICKLKRVANGFSNGTSATQITFGTTPYSVTRIETITTGSINYDKVGYVKKDSSLNRYLLKKNDVLISNINSFERVGNCAIYDGQHELYHGMNLLRITPLDNIVPEYLLYSLKSANYMGQMRRACKPAINQVSVPSSVVKGIIITFPPLSEQEEIAIYCSRALQCIEDSVDNCKKQISLLQERKQIIINDVVTGKIKVS